MPLRADGAHLLMLFRPEPVQEQVIVGMYQRRHDLPELAERRLMQKAEETVMCGECFEIVFHTVEKVA